MPEESTEQGMLVRIQGWQCLPEECFTHPAKSEGSTGRGGCSRGGLKATPKARRIKALRDSGSLWCFLRLRPFGLLPVPVFVCMRDRKSVV